MESRLSFTLLPRLIPPTVASPSTPLVSDSMRDRFPRRNKVAQKFSVPVLGTGINARDSDSEVTTSREHANTFVDCRPAALGGNKWRQKIGTELSSTGDYVDVRTRHSRVARRIREEFMLQNL